MEDFKQKYEEIIKKLKEAKEIMGGYTFSSVVDKIIPELKESEDEKVRKWLIEMVEEVRKANPTNADHNGNCNEAIAWLEKQGEQNSNILQDAFNNSKKDYTIEEKSKASEYAEGVLPTSIMYGESEIEYKLHTIIEAAFIAGQNEQKPAEWSEEDERLLSKLQTYVDIESFDRECNGEDLLNWLKSLKPQHHWKPSEEQDAVGMLVNLGYPISTNGEIPTYKETFDDCKQALLHCLQKEVERVLLKKSISLSSGGVNTERLLKDTYMQAYREGVDDIIKQLKEICS